MQSAGSVRRSSHQLFRPSSCNFARGASHTPPGEDTPSPVTSLTPNSSPPVQELPHEEHHEPTVEGSPADQSNIPIEKIYVGLGSNGAREFDNHNPSSNVAIAKMKEIVRGHFDGPWTSIKFVPDHVKTMWFEEFEKYFFWTETDVAMKKVFIHEAGKHLSQTFSKCRYGGRTPFFVKGEHWKKMESTRTTNVKMVKQADANKKNKSSKRSIENGPYRGGSRKVAKHMKVMETKNGCRPLYSEVVRKLWSKNDGTDMGPLTASCVDEFDRLVAEISSSEPLTRTKEIELWIQACNGPHNHRIFALGEEGAALVRSGRTRNLNGVSTSSASKSQPFMEPLKDEMREMRDEMKAVQVQNKLLQDMLERLLQMHGGANATASQDSNRASNVGSPQESNPTP